MKQFLVWGVGIALATAGCAQALGPQPGTESIVTPQFTAELADTSSPESRRVLSAGGGRFVPGEFILGAGPEALGRVLAKTGGRLKHSAGGVSLVAIAKGADLGAALAAAGSVQGVDFAEHNGIAEAFYVPSDTRYSEQWGLAKVNAPAAWDVSQSSSGVRIAILDSGVDLDHEDLAAKTAVSIDFSSSGSADDLYGHGTHVAGIAAAISDNAVGVAGAGYSASLLNVKVLDNTGSGSYYDIGLGIRWAANDGQARVINMSLGGTLKSRFLESEINAANTKGVVVVAAAGNAGTTQTHYPAAYVNCIAVGASTQSDTRASFSSYGNKWVDVAAPGDGILSTAPNHDNFLKTNGYFSDFGYGTISGTSMATPFVAGEAALLYSQYAAINSTNRARVRSRIESNIVKVGTWVAKGRVNFATAVSSAL